jgi:hypothetical protein
MLAPVVRVLLVLVAWCLAASRPTAAGATHPAQLDVAKAMIDVSTTHHREAQPPLIATLVEPFSLATPARRVLPAAGIRVGNLTPPVVVEHFARGPPA